MSAREELIHTQRYWCIKNKPTPKLPDQSHPTIPCRSILTYCTISYHCMWGIQKPIVWTPIYWKKQTSTNNKPWTSQVLDSKHPPEIPTPRTLTSFSKWPMGHPRQPRPSYYYTRNWEGSKRRWLKRDNFAISSGSTFHWYLFHNFQPFYHNHSPTNHSATHHPPATIQTSKDSVPNKFDVSRGINTGFFAEKLTLHMLATYWLF